MRRVSLCGSLVVLILAILITTAGLGSSATPEWIQLTPSTAPSARTSSAMAYDTLANRTILFGGITEALSPAPGQTWAYDAGSDAWTLQSPSAAPAGQYAASMVYDSRADRVVLFGGGTYGASGWMNETWAYAYAANTWTLLHPALAPPGRNTFGMVYDPRADRIVIFGGAGEGGYLLLSDTWLFDYTSDTWTNVTTPGGPSARAGLVMVYDAASDRVILYGGAGDYGDMYDTWAFSVGNATWWPLNPVGKPFAVRSPVMSFDASTDRVVLFGGYCLGGPSGGSTGTWQYEDAANRWTIVPTSVSPPCLNQAAMVYDSGSEESILFGGYCAISSCAVGFSNATWAYRSGLDIPVPPPSAYAVLPLVLALGLIAAAGAVFLAAVWVLARGRIRPRP